MNLDAREMVSQARDAITVKRVFGEPYEKDGKTIVPVARVAGGGGGGGGGRPEDGWGTGFGLTGTPVGAYVIDADGVEFIPAIDRNAIITRAQIFAIVALLVVGLRKRRRD